MLGLAPLRQAAAVAMPDVYGAPLTGALFASLGMMAFGLLTFMPTTFDGTSVLRTIIALSLTAGGIFGVLIGYVSVSTRIEVGPHGVVITAPGWRACPYPPVQEFELDWDELRAIHHRTEMYRLGSFRLRCEVYALEAATEFIELGSYFLWDLEPVLIDMNRAGCPWCEDPEVEASLLHSLGHGAPSWQGKAWPQPGSAAMPAHAMVSGRARTRPHIGGRTTHGEDPMAGSLDIRAGGDRAPATAAAGLGALPAVAASLLPTPRQTAGPFYPLTLPLDADNDLVEVAGRPERAAGTILHLGGPCAVPTAIRCAGRGSRSGNATRSASTPSARPARPGRSNFQGFGTSRLRGRRLSLSDHRAGALSWAHPAHPFPDRGPRFRAAGHPNVRRGPSAKCRGRSLPAFGERASLVTVPLEPAPALEPQAKSGAKRGVFDIVLGPDGVPRDS